MIKNGMRPVHPGEILFEEFMKSAEPPINANKLAKALEVPANRIRAITKGQRGITGDTAVRLATLFDTTAEFWMNLQKTYELRLASKLYRARSGSILSNTGEHSYRLNEGRIRSRLGVIHAVFLLHSLLETLSK